MESSSLTMDFIRKSLEESNGRQVFSIEENLSSLFNLLAVILVCLFMIFLLRREAEYNADSMMEANAEVEEDEASPEVNVGTSVCTISMV